MTGCTTRIVPEDGIKIETVEDIRRRAARWRCRGTGDGAPNQWRRAQMRDIGCPPRGMGTPRERRGQEAGCPGIKAPRRRPNSSRNSKVRAVHGRNALTVGFSF